MAVIIDIFKTEELAPESCRKSRRDGVEGRDRSGSFRSRFQKHCLAVAAVCWLAAALMLAAVIKELP